MTNNQNINNEILIDDGSIEVAVKNKQGVLIGTFSFKPTDVGIVDRYNETVKSFDKIVESLEHTGIKEDGTAESDFEGLKNAETELFKAINYIFDSEDMAQAFFGNMHPFSPINGKFYCENVLEAIGQYIAGYFNKETEKINRRLKKYTGGYGKGGKK